MHQRDTDGCLFAVGCRIYFFDPLAEEVKLICERPATVTAIKVMHSVVKGLEIWDTCFDGTLRHGFRSEEICFSTTHPLTSIFGLYGGYEEESYPGLIAKGEWVAIATEYDLTANYFIFRNAQTGGTIKAVDKVFCSTTGLPHTFVSFGGSGEVYWATAGKIFRGFDKGKTEVAVIDDSPLIIPSGDSFAVCHYQNDHTHPEGVVISTRDRRTIQAFDPMELGYPRFAGIYGIEGQPFLLLGTSRSIRFEDQGKLTCKISFCVYTKKIRSPFYVDYNLILEEEKEALPDIFQPAGNPCLSLNLDILKRHLES